MDNGLPEAENSRVARETMKVCKLIGFVVHWEQIRAGRLVVGGVSERNSLQERFVLNVY